MKKHLINVQKQIDVNENLIFANNNQKNSEETLVKLAKINDASLSNDIKKIKKEHENILERHNSIQVK